MPNDQPTSLTRMKRFVRNHLTNRRGKLAFVDSCPQGARILDVGCGNNSPRLYKTLRSDIYYVGLDIGDYNQGSDPTRYADEYLLVSPDQFASKIFAMPASFDAIISSHNIEHCNDPDNVLAAMLRAAKLGGRIFLAFPCEESKHFPSRRGTLNFYDDPTHLKLPVYDNALLRIAQGGFRIDVAIRRYRPLFHLVKGAFSEPLNSLRKQVSYGTWALYGFETIIWATRTRASDL